MDSRVDFDRKLASIKLGKHMITLNLVEGIQKETGIGLKPTEPLVEAEGRVLVGMKSEVRGDRLRLPHLGLEPHSLCINAFLCGLNRFAGS